MKKAVSMPCTEEQWLNEVKPLCDKYGLYYNYIADFKIESILTNNIANMFCISNIMQDSLENYNGELIPYNPIEFIKACGVEVEQPKWEKLTRGGLKIIEAKEALGWWIVKAIGYDGREVIYPCEPSGRNKGGNPNFDLIPYNPRKTELLTKKAELEKQLEEINKELNI